VFAVAYILVTGTITDSTVEFGFHDPVVYIIVIFILHAVVMLLSNIVRNPRLIIDSSGITFKSRFTERSFAFADIERIVLKRERRRFNEGTFAVARLYTRSPHRRVRVRIAGYEREKELYQLLKKIKHDMHK
jgi:hypothetical protein